MRFIPADEDHSGFTLIELLVVIAIIAILAVVVGEFSNLAIASVL